MATLQHLFARVWLVLLALACAFTSSCTCAPARQAHKARGILACRSPQFVTALGISSPTKIVPGAITTSFSGASSGDAALRIPLDMPPGRAGFTPELAISYSSSAPESALGMGFALSGASSIGRCRKERALDGEIANVQFTEDDALCLDGKRLIAISTQGDQIEYRTFPDSQKKIIGNFADPANSSFEVFLPNGHRILYGSTDAGRVMSNDQVPSQWLAEEARDARGNVIHYDWCLANDESGYTAEYALTSIRYGDATVVFGYDVREDAQTTYWRGMQMQESLQLATIEMQVKETLVRRYELEYERSETTKRTLLQSVQECAGTGECFAPTRFHYGKSETGFEDIATKIDAPFSDKASPMFFDIDGDGLSDYVVGDSTPASTAEHPMTEWRIAKNLGGTFAPEKVALLQDWSFVQNPEEQNDPAKLQPELGTALDFTGGSTKGILLHDVVGSQANHVILLPQSDSTLLRLDTDLPRPFPVGPSPKGLLSSGASVHIIDVSADTMADLIECTNLGDMPTWKLHRWQPGGFALEGEIIDVLTGYPCGMEFHPVDLDGNGITDIVAPGMIRVNGIPTQPTLTYAVVSRKTDGTWTSYDTKLPVVQGRILFADVNGDHLLDVITAGADGRLMTWMNTGRGFADKPVASLAWDGLFSQSAYLHLAQTLQFDGDHRSDILVPMLDAGHATVPHWVILRATNGSDGFTFEQIDAGIPFQAVLGDVVELADPRMPRVVDVDGNGAADVAIFLDKRLHVFKNRAVDPDVLVGLSDGMTERDPEDPAFVPNVSFSYGHLTDPSVYVAQDDPMNGCTYPRHCAVGAKRVVSEYRVNDGQGGQRRYKLQYRDGRYDRVLGQWLGFGKRVISDVETGQTTIEFFDNVTMVNVGEREVYPLLGQVVKQWAWTPDGDRVEMSFTDRTIDVVPTNNDQTYFTLAPRTHTRRMQGTYSGAGTLEAYVGLVETLESATMLTDTLVDVLDFDLFANVLEVNASTVGVDASTHVTRTVKNDVGKWMLGLPDTQTECSTGAGLTSCRIITRTTNEFGEVITESTSSNDGIDDTKLSVVYEHDQYGNVTKTLADDAFGHRRESTTVYDDDGLFPVKQINGLQHETLVDYDRALGVLTKETDPNGLVTEWKTDGFGRLMSETRPDGSSTTMTRTREKLAGIWRTKQRTTTTGGADDEVVLDSLGRTILALGHGPAPAANTPRIMQKIEYDRLTGNVAKKSVPIAEGTRDTALKFDEYEFDGLGREIRHTTPWGAVNTTTYGGLLIDSADLTQTPALHTVTSLDALGRPQTITDAKGGLTKYVYGPFGALRSITDPGNEVTTWTRDAFGRVRTLDQPDRGMTTFVNDGFGNLVSSTDALGRAATWEFDALGRTTKRTDVHAGKTLTTSWTWDTALHGIGVLHMLTSPDAIKTYSYSTRGQLEGTMLSTGNDEFAVGVTYDEVGRPKTTRYPQPLGQEPFAVTSDYDAHGFVVGVCDDATNVQYWQLTDVDQAGRYREESFGNQTKTVRSYYNDKQALKSISTTLGNSTIQQLSYGWDQRLNLKSRTDTSQATNKTEWFRHDELDRLTCAYFAAAESPGATCATAYGYAPNGNLTSKSDIGTLSYTDPNHPHAVTNAPGSVFTYDAVGNQIGRPGGVTITYTAFDLPETIKKGGKTTSFGYDGDQQRIRKTSATSESLYMDDLFEQVTSGNAQEFRYYVHSPERVIAVVTRGSANAGTNYLHADHLGSVESVTNANGEVVEKRSYDAFGAKRNPQWGTSGGVTSVLVAKGFTGHDEEDEFGLINMKGRLLDPTIGRFTTTDPVISNGWDGQTLNPFSYVHNNPLAFVDPTGFTEEEAWRLWHYNETPGQLGVNITYNQLTPPGSSPEPTAPADINASASTNDVGTTGDGNGTQSPEPIPAPGFWDGVGDGGVNALTQLPTMIPTETSTIIRQVQGTLNAIDAYEQGGIVDAINTANPLTGVVNLGFAINEGDWYTVGLESVGVAVTIVAVVVGKRVMGKGAGTTRGPPTMGPGTPQGPPGASGARVGVLPKPSGGPGSIPKSLRDSKRVWTAVEREAQRKAQGELCATGCGTKIDASNSRGHHLQRHADGGMTDKANHKEVCIDCHLKLHSP